MAKCASARDLNREICSIGEHPQPLVLPAAWRGSGKQCGVMRPCGRDRLPLKSGVVDSLKVRYRLSNYRIPFKVKQTESTVSAHGVIGSR